MDNSQDDIKKKVHEMFEPYFHTQEWKDGKMVSIMQNREKYEQGLDEMWSIFRSGNMQQVVEYKKQVKYIQDAGLQILRSKTTGKHKIVYRK